MRDRNLAALHETATAFHGQRGNPGSGPPGTAVVLPETGLDLADDNDLDQLVAGADVMIHVVWLFQPMRPAFLFKRASASEQRRLFAGCAIHWPRPGICTRYPQRRLREGAGMPTPR